MRLVQFELFHHAVVVTVQRVGHQGLRGVEPVGQQPAVGGHVVARAPDHLGVVVVTALAFHKGLAHGVRTLAGLVVDGAGVALKTGGCQHPGALHFAERVKSRACCGHLNVTPGNGGVAVVAGGALRQAQAVAVGAGVVERRSGPAAVTGFFEHHGLLGHAERIEGQRIDGLVHAGPLGRSDVRVDGTQHRHTGQHALGRIGRRVDKQLALGAHQAKFVEHHVLLDRTQAFKRRVRRRGGHTAPVDAGQVVVGRAKALHHALERGGSGVDVIGAGVIGVTQSGGHHLFLRVGQARKSGACGGRRDAAPADLLVAVIRDQALTEAGQHLRTHRGVVVEEVLDRRHQAQHIVVGVGEHIALGQRRLGRDRLSGQRRHLGGWQGRGHGGPRHIYESGQRAALRRRELGPVGVQAWARAGGAPHRVGHCAVVVHIAAMLKQGHLLGAREMRPSGLSARGGGHARRRPGHGGGRAHVGPVALHDESVGRHSHLGRVGLDIDRHRGDRCAALGVHIAHQHDALGGGQLRP